MTMKALGLFVFFGIPSGVNIGKWRGSATSVVRRYKVDLRPGRDRWSRGAGGATGLVRLVMEGSKAGEEFRLLVFLMLLFWFALCGFIFVGMEGRVG